MVTYTQNIEIRIEIEILRIRVPAVLMLLLFPLSVNHHSLLISRRAVYVHSAVTS